jgi:hypothetical protein
MVPTLPLHLYFTCFAVFTFFSCFGARMGYPDAVSHSHSTSTAGNNTHVHV